jgi:TatD DNase family protein
MAEKYDGVYATVGVHPHQAKTVDQGVIDSLRTLARHPRVVGIGEIGLDYYRDLSPRDVQREAMRRQLELAAEMTMPVVVHSREAHEDVMFILAEWVSSTQAAARSVRQRGVLHAFSGDRSMAGEASALGFCTGIAGPVTFASARSLQSVVRDAPLEQLLIETDAPYLTPHPYRGKRNEPALVALVCAAIAELKGLAPRDVAQVTTENCRRLFELRPESRDNRPREGSPVESR